MFAALCDNQEFYRERMNLFVAIAPGIFVSNHVSDYIKKLSKDQLEMTFFKESGPEVLWQAFDYGRNAGEHSKSNQNEFVIKYMDTMTDRNSDLASE